MFMIKPFAFSPFAIIAGVAAHMVLGMLWYSPLMFGNMWMRILNIKTKDINMHAGHLIGAALVGFTLTLCIAHFSDALSITTCRSAIECALLAWLGFVATTKFSDVIWQGSPLPAYLINVGFWAVDMAIIACLITKL